jgi:anion-transporting  ArsA/GET3 family ATPase
MRDRAAPSELFHSRLLVCLGPGGVGKTTMSAALALGAAMAGRRVDVMTVDPAPRLLDALGLDPHDAAEPRDVPLADVLAKTAASLNVAAASPATNTTIMGAAHAGGTRTHRLANSRGTGNAGAARKRLAAPAGRLRALRLDPKRTFDALVNRHAPSPTAADAILQNRIYGNLSQALAGVGDYMAIERLLQLSDEPETDLVVLDTPPAREALDFLDAPRRLLDLLNSRAIGLLGGGMRRGLGVVDIAARAVLAAFDRLTGLHLLGDVQAFVRSFDGMYGGFAERAERAQMLMVAGDTTIVVVTTAEPERIEQAREFIAELAAAGITTRAVIANRMLPAMPDTEEIARTAVAPALRRKLTRAANDFAALKEREATAIASLRADLPAHVGLFAVPDLGTEPTALRDLARLCQSVRSL